MDGIRCGRKDTRRREFNKRDHLDKGLEKVKDSIGGTKRDGGFEGCTKPDGLWRGRAVIY